MYFSRVSQGTEARVQSETSAWISRFFSISYQNVAPIFTSIDVILITIANLSAWAVCQYLGIGPNLQFELMSGVGFANGLIYASVAHSRGLYRLPVLLAPSRYLASLLMTWVGVGIFTGAFVLLLRGEADISRAAMMISAVLQIVLLYFARWIGGKALRAMLASGRLAGPRVVTIGEPEELLRLSKAVLFRYFGLKEIARIGVSTDHPVGAERVMTSIDRAIDEARILGAERFVVAARWNSKELLETVSERLRASPLPAHLLPDYTCRTVLGRQAMSTRGQNLIVEIQRAPLTPTERAIKRAMDIVMAAGAIVVLSPLLLLTAIAIRLDSRGNIIFRQRRNGFNANQFVIYKFRTMKVEEDGAEIKQARRGDHRVTRVGQFLRRSSIDELPQLFNILKGDMSIVGPRPHALAHDNEYKALIAKYAFRHNVKPGMTGWAQVNGLRGETQRVEQMADRVRLDLWYIDHWSLGLDINIILKTCVEVLRDRAY